MKTYPEVSGRHEAELGRDYRSRTEIIMLCMLPGLLYSSDTRSMSCSSRYCLNSCCTLHSRYPPPRINLLASYPTMDYKISRTLLADWLASTFESQKIRQFIKVAVPNRLVFTIQSDDVLTTVIFVEIFDGNVKDHGALRPSRTDITLLLLGSPNRMSFSSTHRAITSRHS